MVMPAAGREMDYNSQMTTGAAGLASRSSAGVGGSPGKPKSSCKRFCPNVFTPNKCHECFRQKNAHSQEALAENRASRKICKCGYLFVAPIDVDFANSTHRARRWQRRWFVLYDDGELTFSVDDNMDTVPQAVVDMHQVTEVGDVEAITGHEFSIILRTPNQDFYVKGTSREEIRWWYDVLVMYPRSIRYSKQQRSQNQKRSRTLPSNTLSDDQLMALKASSTQEPPVAVLPDAKAHRNTSTETRHDVTAKSFGNELSALSSSSALHEPTNRVKETSAATSMPAAGASNEQTSLPSSVRGSSGSLPAHSSSVSRAAGDGSEDQLPQVNVVNQRNMSHDGSSAAAVTVVSIGGKSSTSDYLDQLKGKRPTASLAGNVIINRDRSASSYNSNRSAVPNEKYFRSEKPACEIRALQPSARDAFGLSTDSFTDTDLSTDSEEVSPLNRPLPQTETSPASHSSSQRFVFTGLTAKDIQDLKQLQRIMSKKTSTGSTSSRSSSSNSIYGMSSYGSSKHLVVKEPVIKHPPDRDSNNGRPRSPPINRTAISRVKERSRVRSRSKSPVSDKCKSAPVTDSQRTLLINGEIKYEEPEQQKTLAKNVVSIRPNRRATVEPKVEAAEVAGTRPKEVSAEGRLKSLRMEYLATDRKNPGTAEQSTQISLDVRHYETMVSNLEKRLIDREQLLREAAQKIENSKKDNSGSLLEKDKLIQSMQEQLASTQRDNEMLMRNCEMSTSLNNKYEKRLEFLIEKMNKLHREDESSQAQKEEEVNGLREKTDELLRSDMTKSQRIKDLEKQLADACSSSMEMGLRKDNLLTASRADAESLREKLMETKSLLLKALEKDEEDLWSNNSEAQSLQTGPLNGDFSQIEKKFLFALKEIKRLRHENIKTRENLESAESLNENLSVELKEAVKLANENFHEDCHNTIDALHLEISSLQARVQNQEKRYITDLANMSAANSDLVTQFVEELQSLELDNSSLADANGCTGQGRIRESFESELQQMQGVYAKCVETLEESHSRTLAEMQAKHERELELLLQRKDQELAEEAKATRAALEIIHTAYEHNLKKEVARLKEGYCDLYKRSDHSGQEDISNLIREEVQQISEKLSAKISSTSETEDSVRSKETFLNNYHRQLLDMSQHYSQILCNMKDGVSPSSASTK